MKILTINVLGIPNGSDSNLIEANVFQDYDAIVIDPKNLDVLYGPMEYKSHDTNVLEPEWGEALVELNSRRREEAHGLLKRGGTIVCFMEPMNWCSFYLQSSKREYRQYRMSNYNWLFSSSELESELGVIKYSMGKTIDNIDSKHSFSEYLYTRPSWSAYVEKDACESWRILGSAFGTHVVSLTKVIESGHIVLLPSDYDYHNGEILEHCIQGLLEGREFVPQPSWAKDILVPGQEEIISRIAHIDTEVDSLEKERDALIHKNLELDRWKYLLYAKGKHQLESVVRDALALIGYTIESQQDKEGDGLVISEHGTILLEAVGSKSTIKIEKLGELIKNIGNFISQKGIRVKGVLVGNPFCDQLLDNRPPKNTQKQLFAKELIESAELQDISVVLSTDLYTVISKILKKELSDSDKKSIQQRLFKGKGLVTL